MIGLLKGIFSSGVVGSVERIASEYIQTDLESAEAKALMVKTLDPNGATRRQLSRFASVAYGFYLAATTVLIFCHSFGLGDPANSKAAIDAITELFVPITTAWGGIVGASFGVNGVNSYKGR